MFRFETLDIWQEAIKYSNQVYLLTRKFPREELFCLTSQLRRAVVSVSTNIAEGSASKSIKDFKNFLNIARKSIFETVSLLHVAEDQGYIDKSVRVELYNKAEVLAKRIKAFSRSLSS